MKVLSLIGFSLLLAAVLCLWQIGSLFSRAPWGIAIQLAAILLMLWARLTFGLRSFHAGANPTAGALITTGPYRFVRHPIYAAICLFLWAGILGHQSLQAISLGALATAGVIVRLSCEERLVSERYPDYRAYSLTTKRLLPGIW